MANDNGNRRVTCLVYQHVFKSNIGDLEVTMLPRGNRTDSLLRV